MAICSFIWQLFSGIVKLVRPQQQWPLEKADCLVHPQNFWFFSWVTKLSLVQATCTVLKVSALVPTLFVSRCFSFELPFELKALYVSPRKLKQTLFGIQIKLLSVNPIESIISACLQNSYSSIENKRACKTGHKYYSKASGNFVSSIKSFKIKSLTKHIKTKTANFHARPQ